MSSFTAWFTLDHVEHVGLAIPVVASVLHTFLPPWEAFGDFPTLQKYYKLFVYCVGYVGLNARSTVWKSLSTNSGQQPSVAALNGSATQPVPPPSQPPTQP